MDDRMIECPECGGRGFYLGVMQTLANPEACCKACKGFGTIPDRRKPGETEDALRAEVLEKDACIVDLLDQRHDRDQDIANLRAEVAALEAELHQVRMKWDAAIRAAREGT